MNIKYLFKNLKSSEVLKDFAKNRLNQIVRRYRLDITGINVIFEADHLHSTVQAKLMEKGGHPKFALAKGDHDIYHTTCIMLNNLENQFKARSKKVPFEKIRTPSESYAPPQSKPLEYPLFRYNRDM